MPVIQISASNKDKFNKFAENHPLGTIHQLFEWGEFQTRTPGRSKFWALALEENGKITASALLIKQNLPFGKSWLFCPRGPLLDYSNPDQIRQIFNQINLIAKAENAIFTRIDPPIPQEKTPQSIIKKLKSRRAHAHHQPESTLLVNLTASEEEILAQMKPKGRYNIKVAQKHEVKIEESQNTEIFYNLFSQTKARDKFSGHPLKYYRNMFETLGPNRVRLFIAKYQEQPVAAAIVTYFAQTATYYFGASSNENRNTMAPYLLHWSIIQNAKSQQYAAYDLFGIAPPNSKNHPWAGVTDFKLKFGGTQVDYMPPQEIVYKRFWYLLMRLSKLFRK